MVKFVKIGLWIICHGAETACSRTLFKVNEDVFEKLLSKVSFFSDGISVHLHLPCHVFN